MQAWTSSGMIVCSGDAHNQDKFVTPNASDICLINGVQQAMSVLHQSTWVAVLRLLLRRGHPDGCIQEHQGHPGICVAVSTDVQQQQHLAADSGWASVAGRCCRWQPDQVALDASSGPRLQSWCSFEPVSVP